MDRLIQCRPELTMAAALVLLLTVPLSCRTRSKPSKKKKGPPLVAVVRVGVEKIEERLELAGSMEPARVARMASPVEGPVVLCKVREGDLVKAGMLLARIGRGRGDRAAAVSARNELDAARVEHTRVKKLVAAGAVPGADLERAAVELSRARARLAQTAERLGDYSVAAPFSGHVFKVNASEGDFVSARTVLMEIFDPESLVLRFAVPEKAAFMLRMKMPLTVTLDAYPNRIFQAEVVRLFPDIERSTRTRIVEARLPPGLSLIPGMFARISIVTTSFPEAVVAPPRALVHLSEDRTVVFVVKKENRVERRTVRVGIETPNKVQITEGLAPGELVVISGLAGLGTGRKVRFKQSGGKAASGSSAKGDISSSKASPRTGAR